ncbi:type I methionyl aminopeptidase [Candidatus Woesebacteria bacterium]|nr:type I methionyl aminopeptidase [Candidatus Woesebacteria bacterium]
MSGPIIKTSDEIKIMEEGGKKLARVKRKIERAMRAGVNALEIEKLATDLIKKEGGKPSFKTVSGYFWSTCINVNEGVVHGIPKKETMFKRGDVASVDVGLFYRGFHTDTSTTILVDGEDDHDKVRFLEIGRKALKEAIGAIETGNIVGDISAAIEATLKKEGVNPIKALVGHGIGRRLHEKPLVPCFISGAAYENAPLREGLVLAIEVMYCQGSPDLVVEADGWTIRTKDGKIAGLFEETVAVTKNGPFVLTE